MDRNSEVKMEYEDALRMMERFQKREQLKVEGNWYLFEKEGHESWVSNHTRTILLFEEGVWECLREYYIKEGWKVTKIKIFREG